MPRAGWCGSSRSPRARRGWSRKRSTAPIKLELRVYANEKHRQAVLVARLDNLGKGASGAAVQNVALMLGLS